MKRGIISILIALFVLFGFSGVVSAEGNLRANIERVSTGDDARGHFDTYQVYFEPLDHDIGINVVSFKLILNNVTVSSDDFSIGQNWYLDSKNDTTHEYVFGSTDERMSVARHIIVTLKAYRINSAQECGLTLQINNPSYHTCEYYHGVYFGKTGTIVDAITYNIECLPHTCEKIVNGNSSTYFDENGDVTDEITYRQQCETNICVKVGSKYYGKNGNEVSYSTFNAECMPHACEKIVNGNTTTYYDADGNTTNDNVKLIFV